MWIKNSVTTTLFVWGFLICSLKLLVAGMTFDKLSFSQFTGVDYAAAIAALGAVYSMRRSKLMKDGKNAAGTADKV